VLTLFLTACQPPPLSGDSALPSLSFIFPQSASDETLYCPEMVVAVDIDNWELEMYENGQGPEEGRGHWHLKDSAGNYLAVATEEWWSVSLGDASDFDEPTFVVINAVLANHDHNELNTAVYPNAAATAEIYVSAEDGCIGSGSSAADSGE
jgi:hypothetical protein